MIFSFITWPGRETMGNGNTEDGGGGGQAGDCCTQPKDTQRKTKIHIKCTLQIHKINSLSFLGCCYQSCKVMVFLLWKD